MRDETIRWCTRAALTLAVLLSLPCPVLRAAQTFVESGGQVVMEAEHYEAKVPRSGHDWLLKTSQSGYAGAGYMEARPNSGLNLNTGYVTTSPELVFNVQFTTTGTYSVWVRGQAEVADGTNDSLHAGLDGTGPASADRLQGFNTTSWVWKRGTMDSAPATLVISTPGLHTIHLWMREDGLRVDKLLLRTSSSSTAPSGAGPAESPRVTIGTDTTPPTVSLSAPAAGATVSGTVTVSATASDNVGVAGVQFKLDGVNLGAEDTTNPYSISWDTTTTTHANHTLSAVARDAAGNTTTSASRTVTVNNVAADTTPPTGSVTINGGAAGTNNTTVTLTLSATDNAGPVAQMRFSNDTTTYSTAEPYATSKTWTMTAGDGTKTVYVQFADAAGNWSADASDAITLDTTPPTLSFTSPADGAVITAPGP